MLKVWGRVNSINVQKVMWAVGELKLKHERIDAGGAFGRTKDADYLKMNPNGLVPTIDDDGFVLWESNAIVRYLGAKHGAGGLWPSDPARRADSDRWMDWQMGTVGPAMFPAFMGLVRTAPEQRDHKAIEASVTRCAELFTIFDQQLGKREFIGGATLTIGDIAMGCIVNRWYLLPIERPHLANAEAYLARLKQRPTFVQHVGNIKLT
jgi:glutathione S-transferase